MINYEEELKKFKPCLDVDEIESAVYTRDLTDIVDILQEMLKTEKKDRKEEGVKHELYELRSSDRKVGLLYELRLSCGSTEENLAVVQYLLQSGTGQGTDPGSVRSH